MTTHILIWINRVIWNRFVIVLRIGIFLLRDLIKIDYFAVSNPLLRFISIALTTYAKSGFPSDTTNMNL